MSGAIEYASRIGRDPRPPKELCTACEDPGLVTISRGVRLKETRFMEIYEIWQVARKNRAIQLNEVINVLLNLGLMTFSRLPQSMRERAFSKQTNPQAQRFREELDIRIYKISSSLKLNDRLGFALPSPAKAIIREQAKRSKSSMSAIARSRILEETAK